MNLCDGRLLTFPRGALEFLVPLQSVSEFGLEAFPTFFIVLYMELRTGHTTQPIARRRTLVLSFHPRFEFTTPVTVPAAVADKKHPVRSVQYLPIKMHQNIYSKYTVYLSKDLSHLTSSS